MSAGVRMAYDPIHDLAELVTAISRSLDTGPVPAHVAAPFDKLWEGLGLPEFAVTVDASVVEQAIRRELRTFIAART